MNRTMREDLYARRDLLATDNLAVPHRAEAGNLHYTYNHYRPHQSLDNLTPARYFANLQAAIRSHNT
jgi:transposase InsO family protein